MYQHRHSQFIPRVHGHRATNNQLHSRLKPLRQPDQDLVSAQRRQYEGLVVPRQEVAVFRLQGIQQQGTPQPPLCVPHLPAIRKQAPTSSELTHAYNKARQSLGRSDGPPTAGCASECVHSYDFAALASLEDRKPGGTESFGACIHTVASIKLEKGDWRTSQAAGLETGTLPPSSPLPAAAPPCSSSSRKWPADHASSRRPMTEQHQAA